MFMKKTPGFAGMFINGSADKGGAVNESTIKHKVGDRFKFTKGDKIVTDEGDVTIKDIVVSSNSLGGAPRVQVYFDYETKDGNKGSDDDNVNNFVKNYL